MTMPMIPTRPIDPSAFAFNRRAFLGRYAGAIGTLALSCLLEQEEARARGGEAPSEPRTGLVPSRPEITKAPVAKPRAKSVICLFQHGGPSQMDLFDPKPVLNRRDGQDHPGGLEIHFDKQAGKLLRSPFTFHRAGQSGLELSELLPHTARIADEIALIRSMTTDSV